MLELVEDVMLDRRDDATERLLDYSEKHKSVKKEKVEDLAWRNQPLQKNQNYPFFGKRELTVY